MFSEGQEGFPGVKPLSPGMYRWVVCAVMERNCAFQEVRFCRLPDAIGTCVGGMHFVTCVVHTVVVVRSGHFFQVQVRYVQYEVPGTYFYTIHGGQGYLFTIFDIIVPCC